MNKVLYVIARDLSLFNLPLLRRLKNWSFARQLKTSALNVDRNARIQPLHFNPDGRFEIGDAFHVGADCIVDLSGKVVIGDRVTISEGAKIFTHSHPIDGGVQDWRKNPVQFSTLTIEDDVWIGAGAIVLSSVRVIGAGAVVAAGSVVRHDVPPLTVVGGTPAKAIRERTVDA